MFWRMGLWVENQVAVELLVIYSFVYFRWEGRLEKEAGSPSDASIRMPRTCRNVGAFLNCSVYVVLHLVHFVQSLLSTVWHA